MQSGNALITHHSGEWYCNTDNRTPANASKLRQGHHALGVDGKLLTDLLGLLPDLCGTERIEEYRQINGQHKSCVDQIGSKPSSFTVLSLK